VPQLLRTAALLIFCGTAPLFAQQAGPAPTASVVFVCHDTAAISNYRSNPAVVRAMVNKLVTAVTGKPDVASAWSSLVSPNDKVGIKISAAGGELFTTHRDVVNAIADGLAAAGHARSSIIVWDRSLGGARGSGYDLASEGYQLRSIGARDGYDAKQTFSSPSLGNLIWGDFEYTITGAQSPLLSEKENTSSISHYSRILTSEVTKVINVPVMSDTFGCGLAGCLYNMTVPNVDNWRRFGQPPDFGASSIPEMYSDPLIKKKVVLNIMDGLLAQYAGGPEPRPNYAVHHATLYASRDPVAVDAIALAQLEAWRTRHHLPPIGKLAGHVEVASQYGLGNADPAHIEVRSVCR
jgi:uncharacterized protein (DUF362 family)